MTNGMDPDKMSNAERLGEVSMLLSMAMMRLWLKHRGQARSSRVDERAFSGKTATIPLAHSGNDGSV